MATVTDPIMLDSTGQDIKNSIDLLTANINRTASNIPYDSNLTIKAAIDGKVSKSGDTMTGNLTINTGGRSRLFLGSTNNNEYGTITMYSNNSSNHLNIEPPSNLASSALVTLPNKAGTIALTSDLEWVLAYQDLTFDSNRVDVSAYSELFVVPKLQGYARSYPTFMLRLPSFDIATAGVEFSGSSITNGIMYGINIDSSNALKLRGTLKGWTTVTFDIYGR